MRFTADKENKIFKLGLCRYKFTQYMSTELVHNARIRRQAAQNTFKVM